MCKEEYRGRKDMLLGLFARQISFVRENAINHIYYTRQTHFTFVKILFREAFLQIFETFFDEVLPMSILKKLSATAPFLSVCTNVQRGCIH